METSSPTVLETHAAWVLAVTFVVSLAYEVWRATARRGVSRHDTLAGLLQQLATLYVLGTVVVALLLLDVAGAAWIALGFTLLVICISIFYYNPVVLPEREPGLVDWVEDLVFTGLLFVAAGLLVHQVSGFSLVAPTG